MAKKITVLANQLPLFPDWQESCPLCGAAAELTTCRRLYSTMRACARCAEGLKRQGWQVIMK
jgi:hypothetical protein